MKQKCLRQFFFARNPYLLWGVCLLYVAFALVLSHTAFFWDSVSILSRPATFLYEKGFSSLSFPERTVTDNLPLSSLLASWWMLFGRSLFSTHLLFILFGLFLIVQLYRLCDDVLGDAGKESLPWVFLVVLSDTTLVTQMLFPMFDTVLVLVAVCLLRSIWKNRNGSIVLYAVLLAMLRSRGVILCFSLALFFLVWSYVREKPDPTVAESRTKKLFRAAGKTFLLFFPALLAASGLVFIQAYAQQDVFGFAPDSPWKWASLSRILHNALAFPFFLADMGKFSLWLALALLLLKMGWKKFRGSVPQRLLLAYLCVAAVLAMMTIPFRNPMSARYYLLLFLLSGLMTGKMLFDLLPFAKARIAAVVLVAFLWAGHLVRYPETMAVSWDSTLSHLPYYGLRRQVESYLDGKGVKPNQVRALFPYDKPLDLVYLNGEEIGPVAYEAFSFFDTSDYVVYSNLANLGERRKAGIDTCYDLERTFSRGAVFFEVWRRKE